jgi:hypothetical protein
MHLLVQQYNNALALWRDSAKYTHLIGGTCSNTNAM